MSIPGSASPLFLATAAAAAAPAGHQIDRSVRFNKADSAYLNRTPSSASNRKTWTWSGWVKRANSDSDHHLFVGDKASSESLSNSTFGRFYIESNGAIRFSGYTTSYRASNALLRDPSAWYHLVVALDTTQSTADDRIKIYVNGVQIPHTEFSVKNNPGQNDNLGWNTATPHTIGARSRSGTIAHYHDGYLAEIHFVDGTALAATDFGEEDSNGVWQPIDCKDDLTYGTNGFYLKFADNSSAASLGTDSSGNSNTFTVNNISGPGGDYEYASMVTQGSDLGYVSGSEAVTAFDGSLSTAPNTSAANNNGNITFTPSPSISHTTSVRAYWKWGNSGATYSYNGGSNTSITASGWITLASGSGTFTSLNTNRDGDGNFFSAIEIDGSILINSTGADNDSLIDTPTNYSAASGNNGGNYATLNSITPIGRDCTFSNGNLDVVIGTGFNSTNNDGIRAVSTIGMTSGKFYFEHEITGGSIARSNVGVVNDITTYGFGGNHWVGSGAGDYIVWSNNGEAYNNGSGSSYGVSWTTGDIIGCAFDADNGNMYIYKNGTVMNSGTPSHTGLTDGPYFFICAERDSNITANFGQRSFAHPPGSSGGPSSDYKSLCTQNLSESAYASIADGSTAFDVKLWQGTGVAKSITGYNFSPDLVWGKARSATNTYWLMDTVRGAGNRLVSADDRAEDTPSGVLTSFNSDGFSIGTNTESNNPNGTTYVGWAWDAGTSTVSNTDGSVTANVRANASAGFSIISVPSIDSTNTIRTAGHGLNATPYFIISKNRDFDDHWFCYHKDVQTNNRQQLRLNTTDATITSGSDLWAHTSSVIGFNGALYVASGNTDDLIFYCWTPVEGFSAFGSYTANASTDGPFVFTGFRPRWIMIKASSSAGDMTYASWLIIDSERDTYNVSDASLFANKNAAEGKRGDGTGTAVTYLDILSNGFKLRINGTEVNGVSGQTYIYAAWAEHPLRTARAR